MNINLNKYIENDKNKKILFLHGFNSSISAIRALINLKNRNYDIVAFDFPGCGLSKGKNDLLIDDYELTAINFVKNNFNKKPIVIGHSFGTASALRLEKEGLSAGTILISPFNPFIHKYINLEQMKRWLIPHSLDDAIESTNNLVFNKEKHEYFNNINTIARILFQKSKEIREKFGKMVDEQILNSEYANNHLTDLYKDTSAIIIEGIEDKFVPLDSVNEVVRKFGCKLIKIPNCGHVPIYEQTNIINKIIEKFDI